ncbi:hypothetical protein ACU19_00905 [Actinobaculum suis]|nr:hypothetical protein ACU19_00905 [Actinobaculum suis]
MEQQDSFTDFMRGVESPGLVNWAEMPTYNTIMALAAGVALVMIALLIRDFGRAAQGKTEGMPLHTESAPLNTDAYAIGFAVVGIIQFFTGLHMTVTWPLASGGFAFDNIIFGETCLAFGTLLVVAAFYLWKRGQAVREADNPLVVMAGTLRPLSIFIGGLGLALFSITLAGLVYQLYAAPPQEPISGYFAPYPWFEAIFLSSMFFLVGLGAFLFPFAVYRTNGNKGNAEAQGQGLWRVIFWVWIVGGVIFGLFGALNFYTHIGFIVNTQ